MTYMARHVNCGSSPQAIAPNSNLAETIGRCDENSLSRTRLAQGRETSAAASGPASLGALVAASALVLAFA